MNPVLPPHWSHNNPIDILGDATPERYAKAVEIVAADPESDGLLVVLTPQAMTDPTQTAERLKPFARIGKPILASWMGGSDVAAGMDILNRAGIPTFLVSRQRREGFRLHVALLVQPSRPVRDARSAAGRQRTRQSPVPRDGDPASRCKGQSHTAHGAGGQDTC